MPDWKAELTARLDGLKLQPAREAEVVEELSLHLDDRYRELRESGASEDEARRQALAELADPEPLAGMMRRLRQAGLPESPVAGAPPRRVLGDLWQDLRYAGRGLRKRPAYTGAAALTLALGIGANTAIFSLVSATLLESLPVHDPQTLVYLTPRTTGSAFSYPEYAELRDHNTVLDGLVAWGGITASLNDGETDLVGGVIVTGNYFDLLGVRAARGRALSPSDDLTPDAHPVAVISHGLWQRRFGGRPDIVGHEVLLNGRRFTIVGVPPEAFGGAQRGVRRDLYVPMMMQALIRPPRAGYSGEMDPDLLRTRGNRWLFLAGRLKPGVNVPSAQEALSTLSTRFGLAAQPGTPERPVVVIPVNLGDPNLRARMVSAATLLLAVVGAVLLIACANVANLALSRALARRREIALRLSLGASRGRLVRQLLTESVLLALLGGAGGLLLAAAVIQAWQSSPPPPGALPVVLAFSLDVRVFLFTFALSVATGILFGLAPALRASRADLVPALKDESFVPDERSRRLGLRKVLVVSQVALSLALLAAAGLFLRSLRQTQAVDPGFDADRLLAAPLQVNLLRYTRPQGRDFYRRVMEQVEALPGVESTTVARIVPLSGGGSVSSLHIEGRPGPDNQFRSDGGGATATGRDTVSRNVVGPA
jgi:putative ABC transport system permease protein